MKVSGPSGPDLTRVGQTYGPRGEQQNSGALPGPPDVGQLLRGRVVSIDAAGLLTVETEAGSFKAMATTPLPVGREFLFQVVQTGGSPLLAEAGRANAALNLLRVMLPGMFGADGTGGVVDPGQDAAIRAFMAEHAADGRPDPVKLIKTMVQFNRSQSHEGKALTPQAPLGDGGPETPAAVQKFHRLVEAHAAVNQSAVVGSANSDYVIFPVFFAEQAGRGEWLLSYNRESGENQGEGGEGTSLSFYLAMSRLGDLHMNLTSRHHSLNGTITLGTEAAADHVRQHLPVLVQALERLIGGPVAIACRAGSVDCLKTLRDDLTAQAGLAERYALIDIRA